MKSFARTSNPSLFTFEAVRCHLIYPSPFTTTMFHGGGCKQQTSVAIAKLGINRYYRTDSSEPSLTKNQQNLSQLRLKEAWIG